VVRPARTLLRPVELQLDLGWTEQAAEADSTGSVVVVERDAIELPAEPRGVVYTKPWVVELILDLAGYRPEVDLADLHAVEPSAGEGAFLVPMIRRLLASLEAHGRPLDDAAGALRAYELDSEAGRRAVAAAVRTLLDHGVGREDADRIAQGWVHVGDYLLDSRDARRPDVVVGNPPYIRYDDIPEDVLSCYRALYPTMVGRGDIYIGFMEAAIRTLKPGGVLAFICADRWMRSAYGVELRRLITSACGVEAVIEMHNAPAFEDEVAAYPAVAVIRRGPQRGALIASAGPDAGGSLPGMALADAIRSAAHDKSRAVPGFSVAKVDAWFSGSAPWPALEPHQLELLQYLEANFAPLEDPVTGTKIGIGVASGADRVYITKDADVVEDDRLLPLAMAADTREGAVKWSGNYLVNPWTRHGDLVQLEDYPRLRAYFEGRAPELRRRNIAQRRPRDWYRTIDKVNAELLGRPKLYFPDMKMSSNPTLDDGRTYPHHNLYYLTSDGWDLEVLGGLLLSRVAQIFIEAYCVKMRGGTLRFQAQYLRRIRVPEPFAIVDDVSDRLRAAFWSRDASAATSAAIDAYGIGHLAGALGC